MTGVAAMALAVVSVSLVAPPWVADGFRSAELSSDGAQLVFFAGLEGSGHHFLESLLEEELVDYLPAELPKQWDCGYTWEREFYREAVGRFRSIGPGGVNVLPQQFSYPMCCLHNRPGRMHDCHPRMDWLAEAAQEAGAELHVILLHRSLADCLAASCIHRPFDSCPGETDTLISNAKILTKHMQSLRPERISCHRYGERESMQAAIQKAFGGTVPQHLVEELWNDTKNANNSAQVHGWDHLVHRLQASERMLEQICVASEQLNLEKLVKRIRRSNVTQRCQ